MKFIPLDEMSVHISLTNSLLNVAVKLWFSKADVTAGKNYQNKQKYKTINVEKTVHLDLLISRIIFHSSYS